MAADPYNLKAKSDTDLHRWIVEHEPTTDKHVAGIQELMRRNEAPVRKREMVVLAIAVISMAITIVTIMITY